MKQSTALDILKTGKNVFLTGSAGAGKTYTINQYLRYLRARDVNVAVTASTGIAATHMNGMTIHSWSGIGIADELTAKDLARIKKRQIVAERIERTQVLVIDEISMLHKKQFDMINQVMQAVKDNDLPFGGVQLLVAGDFFQLPPIGEPSETTRDKFAFMSQAWLDADFAICYLTEQHRQKTQNDLVEGNQYHGLDLNAILNQIRRQEFTEAIMPALQATAHHALAHTRTRLYTHNINVNSINEQELAKLTTPSKTYLAWSEGDEKLIETLKKGVRNNPELLLKIGAKVMFIKNNSDMNVSNGTMGTVVGFAPIILEKTDKEKTDKENTDKENTEKSEHSQTINENPPNDNNGESKTNAASENETKAETIDATDITDTISQALEQKMYPVVELNDGRKVTVEYESWRIDDEEGEILAAYYHIPLTLAWAITIHKSQGMTLDAAEIDLSKTFEKGQGYVALSRLKQLSGLQLLGFNELSLQLDPLARGADKRFIELSDEQESEFLRKNPETIKDEQNAFILKSRGTLDKNKIEAYEKRLIQREKALKQRQHSVQQAQALASLTDGTLTPTLLETKALLDESLDIADIAEIRNLAQSTIMGHIEKLQVHFSHLNVGHIRPDDDWLEPVKTAYNKVKQRDKDEDKDSDGTIKLRAIYDEIRGEYSYNEIRLALLFIQK